MADTLEIDESEFDKPPFGIKPGQLRTAWQNREQIWAKADAGKTTKDMIPVFHVPGAAIDWVVARRAALPAAGAPAAESAPDGSPIGRSDQPAAASRAEESPPPATPPPRTFPTQRPAQQATPAAPAAEQPVQGEPFRPVSAPGPDLSSIGSPMRAPQVGGAYEVPDIYATLFNVCKAWGLKPEEANGVVFTFAYQAAPDDIDALRRILVTAGKNRWVVDSIVNTWGTVVQQMGGEGSPISLPRGAEERIHAVQKRLGIRDASKVVDPDDMAVEDLERQEHLLKIQETKLAIEERQRALTARSGGTPPGEDDMVDILLDVNGVPTPRRIRASQLGMYQPYTMQPRQNQPQQDEGPPAWFKPYAEKIATDAEERKLERAKREQTEAVQAAVGPLAEEIKRLKESQQSNPQQSELGRKYDALIEQIRNDSAKDLQTRLDRMEGAIRSSNNPDVALQIIDRERAVAGRMGMIPALSAGQLQADQVALEAERDTNRSRNAAQTELFHVVTDRAKEKPVKDLVTTLGIDQVAKGVLRKNFATEEERAGTGVAPNPDEMLAAAQSLESQTGERPPLPDRRGAEGTTGIVLG